MKSPHWLITNTQQGDVIPILTGGTFLFVSVPAFIMLLVNADRGSSAIARPLLVVLGIGIALGLGLLIFGIRICSTPGSLAYRITHRPFFLR